MSEAMRSGWLSYSKVRALTRIATPVNEEQLLEAAASPAAPTNASMRTTSNIGPTEARRSSIIFSSSVDSAGKPIWVDLQEVKPPNVEPWRGLEWSWRQLDYGLAVSSLFILEKTPA